MSTSKKAKNTSRIEKSLEESLILYVMSVGDLLRKKGDIICQRLGITTQQWLIMLHLANDPNIPYFADSEVVEKIIPSDLADALSVSRPNITNLLGILVAKGLVQYNDTDESDRRCRRVELTPAGWEIVMEIEPFRRKANRALLGAFSKADKMMMLEILQSCQERLSK